jgi:hypothetical protein
MVMPPPPAQEWNVVVVMPAEDRYARVARTTAATCAVLEGFDVDRLDDVRLLVDEVFAAILGGGARHVEMRIALDEGRLVLELIAQRDGGGARDHADVTLVRDLADVLATEVSMELDRDPPRFAATLIMH